MRTEIKTKDGEVLSFWVSDAGGYVYRETDDRPCQLGVQVCDGLAERGDTLRWHPSHGEFAEFIRAERARGLRKARRSANRRTWR